MIVDEPNRGSGPRGRCLLTGGRVLDGAGNPWIHADVAIREDRITVIGDARAAGVEAQETVDVGGLLVTPGLWDVHSHADLDSTEGKRALPLLGCTLAEIARGWDLALPAAVRRIVLENGEGVGGMNLDIYDAADIRKLARKEWMLTCSDGIPPSSPGSYTHPRLYGAFSRKLRELVIEERVITLPFAIRGMTSLPAAFFSVHDRGLLKPGFIADVAVFDEARIRDRATYDDPRRYSEGTVHVLVNGRFAFRDGKPAGNLAGRPIRRP